MITNPVVEVIEISIDPVLKRILGPDGIQIRVDLGDIAISRNFNMLLATICERPSKMFLLRWTGGRVPVGAEAHGHIITWTQHGIVYADGRMIGAYDRLIDNPGRDGAEQVMLVQIFLNLSTLPRPKKPATC